MQGLEYECLNSVIIIQLLVSHPIIRKPQITYLQGIFLQLEFLEQLIYLLQIWRSQIFLLVWLQLCYPISQPLVFSLQLLYPFLQYLFRTLMIAVYLLIIRLLFMLYLLLHDVFLLYKYYYFKVIYLYNFAMLNLVDRNLKNLSENEIGKGINVKHLDVSCNQLSRGIQFKPLTNIITLVIDDNKFFVLTDFPIFPLLETFSANKNSFSDLSLFLNQALDRFGSLKNLSTLKNPLNPFFQGEQKYRIFRDQVLQKFPQLQTLDGCAVTIMKKQKINSQKKQEDTYEKLKATASYDAKYASDQLKTVKTRSVGHRFIKNNQL